jgi:predicted DNA-binding transcriptional regulator YafY
MEWLTAENADVLLQVDVEVASHFIDGVILPNQQVLKELPDGSLLVSSRVSKLGDIMPILKQWMPRIEILSPTTLKLELMRELYASLDRF